MLNLLTDSKGSALAGALVGAAILGIISAAFATMMTNSQKETRVISQKMELMEAEQLLCGPSSSSSVTVGAPCPTVGAKANTMPVASGGGNGTSFTWTWTAYQCM